MFIKITLLALYVGILTNLLLNASGNWYDVAFWHLSLILVNVIALGWLFAPTTIDKRYAPLLVGILFCTVIVGMLPSLRFRHALREGYSGPGIPLRDLKPAETQAKVERLRRACGFPPNPRHVVVDDMTYPFLQRTFQPFPITYSLVFLRGPGALAMFKQRGSDGMLVRCRYGRLIPDIALVEDGDLCCASFR